ncbi:hypothetical protein QBZ16_003620 [Prototheca wickerhamii]|uniref:YEATS domain-containing protein n=1 Tax=Prototheca wickerhamii TaxID=3111 RepID=A0AAD9MKW3_PROWI|nr:hypothetical protein QBZ16_003620 [Prototheca wickerhamii]
MAEVQQSEPEIFTDEVTFDLHSSFANPRRDIEFQPYELTEVGWGEFDIIIRAEAQEDPVELYHHLTLYDASGTNNTKRPVVHEVYDEVVFWEPTEAFYALWNARVVGPAPHSQLEQFFLQFDPDYEYRRLQHARQRVAAITANVKGQIAALESAA